MNSTLDTLLQEGAEQNGRTEETQSRIISLNRELASQKEKLDRAYKQVGQATRGIHHMHHDASQLTFRMGDLSRYIVLHPKAG